MQNQLLYAGIDQLKALIAQAEAEHHEGSLGIVRIVLRNGGCGNSDMEIDDGNPLHERVLIG